MKRILVPLFLFMIVGIFATLALMSLGEPSSSSLPGGVQATATFAAEQFHVQLTAIAEEGD